MHANHVTQFLSGTLFSLLVGNPKVVNPKKGLHQCQSAEGSRIAARQPSCLRQLDWLCSARSFVQPDASTMTRRCDAQRPSGQSSAASCQSMVYVLVLEPNSAGSMVWSQMDTLKGVRKAWLSFVSATVLFDSTHSKISAHLWTSGVILTELDNLLRPLKNVGTQNPTPTGASPNSNQRLSQAQIVPAQFWHKSLVCSQ